MPEENQVDEFEAVPAASLSSMQRLAKTTAVATFQRKLEAMELPSTMAAKIARAVVDPTEARNRLDRLTKIRVPGGMIHALETTVWATAAVPYVVNNREASERHFPAGVKIGSAEAARYRPLRPPTDPSDGSARLIVRASNHDHLVWSLDRSARFLIENNDLTESVGAQGIMQYVTLAVVRVAWEGTTKGVTMLGSIDGSSRVNSAHAVLGLTPQQVVFDFPRDERLHRQHISALLDNLERPITSVAEEDVRKLRALEIPARILIKFEPDEVAPVTFSKAVESFVHLVHVEPPKPWDAAASLDAKADSVLNELETQGQITPRRKAYYEGMLTPEEAKAIKLAPHLDERALNIVALISSDKNGIYRAVREGVLLLSKRGGQVRQPVKAEIAVELALRGVRSNLKKSDARGARETLQNIYLHSNIWAKNLRPSGKSPEDLRDEALSELKNGGPHTACLQLAAQGAYWLAVQRILREARFFDTDSSARDGRTPQRVLDDLMKTPKGIHSLHRAIVDGRLGVPIVQVDDNGTRVKGVNGKILPADHGWLRGTAAPPQPVSDAGNGDGDGNGTGPLPDRILLTRISEFRRAIDDVEDKHKAIREVMDVAGKRLVDEDGIAVDVTNDLRQRLDDIRDSLLMYGKTWAAKHEDDDSMTVVDEEEDAA